MRIPRRPTSFPVSYTHLDVYKRQIEFDEGIRIIAVSHQDDVEVVNSETRIFPGDQVIVAADTDLLARAREIVRSL